MSIPLKRRRHVFSRREVLVSFLILVTVCVSAYAALYAWDFVGVEGAPTPWGLMQLPGAEQTMLNLGEVMVGVLGVALTVVTIIVELASNRYTPRITELFLRDPVNGFMMGFFVCTAVLVLWVDMSLYGGHHPQAMVTVSFALMSVSLLALLPYFAYVFDFLLPTRVVHRIQQKSCSAIRRVRRRGDAAVPTAREEVLTMIEQLGDIALNSVDKKDKGISIAALEALSEIATANLVEKRHLTGAWFETVDLLAGDQDFIAQHPDLVRGLAVERTWLEMKVLRQYQAVYEEALIKLRDIGHLIAIHTKRIALVAAQQDDEPGLRMSIKFLNTFMRGALNAGDQRSAYNLMNEYRSLAESLVGLGKDASVVEIAERSKYYGQLAFKMRMPFILETTAYDVCTLLEKAHEARSPCHEGLLEIFLGLDRAPEGDSAQDASLRGVRKAQAKLASWYLAKGDMVHARRIYEDMRVESPARLRSIRAELLSIATPDFWEVSDRGVNFEYLAPELRDFLEQFFRWFDADRGSIASAP
jgi:hypothetical protein